MSNVTAIQQCLTRIVEAMRADVSPPASCYDQLVEAPFFSANVVLSWLITLDDPDETGEQEPSAEFLGALFALDACISYLQSILEHGYTTAQKEMTILMTNLADLMQSEKYSLSFWLPILNIFYDARVVLSPGLKTAYLTLVEREEARVDVCLTHLDAVRGLMNELKDLSVFDVAEHFFAQSYVLSPDFFHELVMDLCDFEEGLEVALLSLLHPDERMRNVALHTLEMLWPELCVSALGLSRLQMMMAWSTADTQRVIKRWIRTQRCRGFMLQSKTPAKIVKILSSEVDGSGSQGLFIHVQRGRKHRLCGILLKQGYGVKDAWLTPEASLKDFRHYETEVLDDSFDLKEVDLEYVEVMVNHFIAVGLSMQRVPDLYLLAIQEELGVRFVPEKMDVEAFFEEMLVQIRPFNAEVIQHLLDQTQCLMTQYRYARSWYMESSDIDRIVNHYATYVEGQKTCDHEAAMMDLLKTVFAQDRQRWFFHCVWVAYWLKSKKPSSAWQVMLIVAYCLHRGDALEDLLIMRDIASLTVAHSLETMQLRRTHLTDV